MHIAEIRTVAKSLPPLRWNTHKSLILSYSADFSVIQKKKYYSYQGEKCSFFYYHIQEEVELQGIENKKTNEKYLSIKKTLHMMKDLMDKATETSN